MQSYEKAVDELLKLKAQVPAKESQLQIIHTASTDILSSLKINHKAICDADPEGILFRRLFSKLIASPTPQLTALAREMLEILYLKDSLLLQRAVYPNYSTLLRRFIEAQEGKGAELDQLMRVVYANEAGRHNRFLREREELHSSPYVRDLYSIHFGKPRTDPEGPQIMEKSMEMEQSQSSTADKRAMKSLLLCLLYRNLSLLDPPALQQYLKMIYIYCGGEPSTYSSVSSFYLLQKRNLFNLFRYSISEVEIEWMLLALYELSSQSNALKFELLAAINMIYKKTANESMFKYSEIAQSIIHLLEDEYIDLFA